MTTCFFVSDLHGLVHRYNALFKRIRVETPDAVFLGGDLLPHMGSTFRPRGNRVCEDFIGDYLAGEARALRESLGDRAPRIFLILGNACVSPSPFLLKDWERYDVSRFVDPGCVPPEAGYRSVPVEEHEILHRTIAEDLDRLVGDEDLSEAIFMFHVPPYETKLDRAALDGRMIDHVPLDVHVGSIAVERFLRTRQPAVSLHGHIHESARITGSWRDRIGDTHCFSAAHDDPELALVRFDPDRLDEADRRLI